MRNDGKNCIFLDDGKRNVFAEYLPQAEDLDKLASLFSAFSDKTRLKILSALAVSPLCVNDLCCVLSINQTTLSHQLATLRRLGLVVDERRGKIVFYRLKGDAVPRILLDGVDAIRSQTAPQEQISALAVQW